MAYNGGEYSIRAAADVAEGDVGDVEFALQIRSVCALSGERMILTGCLKHSSSSSIP